MFNVKSDINELSQVIVHKPGRELLNITEEMMDEVEFSDIPFLDTAIKEHDAFVKVLKDNSVSVLYLEDLMSEILATNDDVRIKFIAQFVDECSVKTKKRRIMLAEYLNSIEESRELVLKTMEGILLSDVVKSYNVEKTLVDMTEDDLFIAAPMPNLYFTRDPFVCVGSSVVLCNMKSKSRSREGIYAEYIFKYHTNFREKSNLVYNRNTPFNIEGGDILVLDEKTILVGLSARTEAEAIDRLAINLFQNRDFLVENIIVLSTPDKKSIKHLDSVITQVDKNKFIYAESLIDDLRVYSITEGDDPTTFEDLRVERLEDTLEDVLSKYTEGRVKLIPCGNTPLEQSSEQWNSACNLLTIKPGTVVSYTRNKITNKILEENDLRVILVPSSELSRGKGGPHSMCSPLIREN